MADYHLFGWQMPNKRFNPGAYRYAYQGQERDSEPEAGWEAFELRLWDGRLGRWFAPDPYGQHHSPYLGMGNDPTGRIDPDGGADIGCPWSSGGGFSWGSLIGNLGAAISTLNFDMPAFDAGGGNGPEQPYRMEMDGGAGLENELYWENLEPYSPYAPITEEGIEPGALGPFDVIPLGAIAKGGISLTKWAVSATVKRSAVKVVAKEGGTKLAPKLLNQFNSAESLIQGARNLSKVKGGMQGFVKGDGPSIFKAITQGSVGRTTKGGYIMENGTVISKYFSSNSGDFTIFINQGSIAYKIRVIP